jgi:predicted site-specific integrase-resolvase
MPNDTANPKYLGSTEACERIGIDRSTLTRWVQLGRIAYAQKLPGPKGVYLFDPVEVERARADYQADRPAS